MGEKILIDFNNSSKMQPFDGQKGIASSDNGKEKKCPPDLISFSGDRTNSNGKVMSSIPEKCILDRDYDGLIPQMHSPIKADKSGDLETSNLRSLSPIGCSQENSTNPLELDIIDSNLTNPLSPFGLPMKVRSKGVKRDLIKDNSIEVAQFLPAIEDSKSPIAIGVFDIKALEEKFNNKQSSDHTQDDSKSRLLLPSITSTGSGESAYGSCGIINKGFLESKSPADYNLSQSPNDSVLEEAKAMAEEFSRMAWSKLDVPTEGIEGETSSIVSNCTDLDDIENADMKLSGNEMDELLDNCAKENNYKPFEEESFRKTGTKSPKM